MHETMIYEFQHYYALPGKDGSVRRVDGQRTGNPLQTQLETFEEIVLTYLESLGDRNDV
jgi:hypothetical protein